MITRTFGGATIREMLRMSELAQSLAIELRSWWPILLCCYDASGGLHGCVW